MKRKVVVPLIAVNYVEVEIDDTFPNDIRYWSNDQLKYVQNKAAKQNYTDTGNSEYEFDECLDHWEIEEE